MKELPKGFIRDGGRKKAVSRFCHPLQSSEDEKRRFRASAAMSFFACRNATCCYKCTTDLVTKIKLISISRFIKLELMVGYFSPPKSQRMTTRLQVPAQCELVLMGS
jgi:hypothetical protein